MGLPPLGILTIEEQHKLVLSYLKRRAEAGPVNILEAGCGRRWYFDLQGAQYKLTGLDLDIVALESRKSDEKDLHEAIVGDLRDAALPPNTYDVIYNSYVLEHIEGAQQVLNNFRKWLKPNGLLIVYIPDRASAYSFLSMHTPHWIHVLFYRYLLRRRDAGKPGCAPYPTYYDAVVSREGMREYARNNQLNILEEWGYFKPRGLASLLITCASLLSLGRLSASHCDLLFILEGNAVQPEPASVPSRGDSYSWDRVSG
jgi:SAM-dependent methyltransferase